jgi:hypothetical protein
MGGNILHDILLVSAPHFARNGLVGNAERGPQRGVRPSRAKVNSQ